ncbi:hypothetical protein ACFX12_009956 [Malus domestica]
MEKDVVHYCNQFQAFAAAAAEAQIAAADYNHYFVFATKFASWKGLDNRFGKAVNQGFSKVIEARDTIKDASVQCERPVDCLSLCGECTANMCKTGRCVCGCANKKSMAEAITGSRPGVGVESRRRHDDPHHFCYWDWQCEYMATCPPGCNADQCNNGYCAYINCAAIVIVALGFTSPGIKGRDGSTGH